MRYLFLAYADEQQWSAMSVSERAGLENECRASDKMLRQSGHLLAGEALRNSSTSILVRVQDGQLCLTDGPAAADADAAASLSAFYLISARDLNEAIRVASTMPQAHSGLIEVRPLTTQGISDSV